MRIEIAKYHSNKNKHNYSSSVGPSLLFQIQFVLDYELILYFGFLIYLKLLLRLIENTKELDELCQKNLTLQAQLLNLNEIVEVAKKHNLIIVSDEIYFSINYY